MGQPNPKMIYGYSAMISLIITVIVWAIFGSSIKKNWIYLLVFGIPFGSLIYQAKQRGELD